jgi:enoyl-CoA hydratase/carnithine racemase
MGNALLLLRTADVYDSADALRLNFVQKVVPAAGLLPEAMRVAGQIAAQAPLAVVATRQNVLKAVEHGPLVAMHDFIPVQKMLSNSDDAAEGVRSFVEKRAARFTGT